MPYYVISIGDHGNGGAPDSQYLTYDPVEETYTFHVPLQVPQSPHDVQGAANFNGGAVTIVEQPTDGEPNLNNNLSLVPIDVPVNIGVVETTNVSYTFAPVAEDSDAGSAIAVSQATQGQLTAHNEKVTSSTFTVSGDFSGKSAGDQVGTIIYDGQAYPVIYNGGTATCTVSFGTGGYDPGKDFRVIWGTVATDNPDGTGNVVWNGAPGGTPQVTDWNHTGGNMSMTVSSTVVDKASGSTGNNVAGTSNAAFIPAADAPTALQADSPADSVGAGQNVSFNVSGTFPDYDGSEGHFFLVEQKEGWGGDYVTTVIDGVSYFMVPANSNSTENATATVTLTTPADLDSDQTVNLKVGGIAVDGSDIAHSFTGAPSVNVNIGVVDSTAVTLTTAATGEDVPVRLDFSANGANESVTQVIIHDLQGGTLEYSDGTPFTGTTLVFPPAQGDGYYYRPAPDFSGRIELNYTATVSDNASGESKELEGQSGEFEVTPVTDLPTGPQATPAAPVDEAGHKALVNIELEATFTDNTGTEDHFFVLQLPAGVTPPDGWTQITDAKLLDALGLTSQVAYRVEAGVDGTAGVALNVAENTTGATVNYYAVAVEKSTLGDAVPDYKSAQNSVTLPSVGAVNLAPTVSTSTSDLADTLRDPGQVVNGTLPMRDDDGDAITVTGLNHNGVPGSPGSNTLTVAGVYGSLTINTLTGDYSYTLNNGANPPDGFQESFAVTVSDSESATATANININLNAPNTPPPAQQLGASVGGSGAKTASGAVSLVDPESDAVTISQVRVNGTVYTAGPGGTYTINGLYGTFVLNPDGTYSYTLTNTNATGVDVLEVVRTDTFGAASTATVSVEVKPVVSGPSFMSLAAGAGIEAFMLPDQDAGPDRAEAPAVQERAVSQQAGAAWPELPGLPDLSDLPGMEQPPRLPDEPGSPAGPGEPDKPDEPQAARESAFITYGGEGLQGPGAILGEMPGDTLEETGSATARPGSPAGAPYDGLAGDPVGGLTGETGRGMEARQPEDMAAEFAAALEDAAAGGQITLSFDALPASVPSAIIASGRNPDAPQPADMLAVMLEEQADDLSCCLEGLKSFFGHLRYGSDMPYQEQDGSFAEFLPGGFNPEGFVPGDWADTQVLPSGGLFEGAAGSAGSTGLGGLGVANEANEEGWAIAGQAHWAAAPAEEQAAAMLLEMAIRNESGGC